MTDTAVLEPETPAVVNGAPGAMIVIISGPSGVGKDTILRLLKATPADPARHFVVTYKTRAPRPDEIDGVDYNFVSPQTFERLQAEGAVLEASETHGHWAGTPRDQVADAIAGRKDAILKIDVQGAAKIKAIAPDALSIFVNPQSRDDLHQQIVGRGTESGPDLERRERDAEWELAQAERFDRQVTNKKGSPQDTAQEIDRIIREEHARHPSRRVRL